MLCGWLVGGYRKLSAFLRYYYTLRASSLKAIPICYKYPIVCVGSMNNNLHHQLSWACGVLGIWESCLSLHEKSYHIKNRTHHCRIYVFEEAVVEFNKL